MLALLTEGGYNRLRGNWGEKTLRRSAPRFLVPCRCFVVENCCTVNISLLKFFHVFNFHMPAARMKKRQFMVAATSVHISTHQKPSV